MLYFSFPQIFPYFLYPYLLLIVRENVAQVTWPKHYITGCSVVKSIRNEFCTGLLPSALLKSSEQ